MASITWFWKSVRMCYCWVDYMIYFSYLFIYLCSICFIRLCSCSRICHLYLHLIRFLVTLRHQWHRLSLCNYCWWDWSWNGWNEFVRVSWEHKIIIPTILSFHTKQMKRKDCRKNKILMWIKRTSFEFWIQIIV